MLSYYPFNNSFWQGNDYLLKWIQFCKMQPNFRNIKVWKSTSQNGASLPLKTWLSPLCSSSSLQWKPIRPWHLSSPGGNSGQDPGLTGAMFLEETSECQKRPRLSESCDIRIHRKTSGLLSWVYCQLPQRPLLGFSDSQLLLVPDEDWDRSRIFRLERQPTSVLLLI